MKRVTNSAYRPATPAQPTEAQLAQPVRGPPGDGCGHLGLDRTSPWNPPVGCDVCSMNIPQILFKIMGGFPEVLNFHRLFLKLNWSMCNQQWDLPVSLIDYFAPKLGSSFFLKLSPHPWKRFLKHGATDKYIDAGNWLSEIYRMYKISCFLVSHLPRSEHNWILR